MMLLAALTAARVARGGAFAALPTRAAPGACRALARGAGAFDAAAPAADGPSDAATTRAAVPVGATVDVVQKEHQRTGELTRGVVARHLTRAPVHPRGIKVLLASSVVGRVFTVVAEPDAPLSPADAAALRRTPNPQRGRRRRGGGRRSGGGGGGGGGGPARRVASYSG